MQSKLRVSWKTQAKGPSHDQASCTTLLSNPPVAELDEMQARSHQLTSFIAALILSPTASA